MAGLETKLEERLTIKQKGSQERALALRLCSQRNGVPCYTSQRKAVAREGLEGGSGRTLPPAVPPFTSKLLSEIPL